MVGRLSVEPTNVDIPNDIVDAPRDSRGCQYSLLKRNINRDTAMQIRVVVFPSMKYKLSHDCASAFVIFLVFNAWETAQKTMEESLK